MAELAFVSTRYGNFHGIVDVETGEIIMDLRVACPAADYSILCFDKPGGGGYIVQDGEYNAYDIDYSGNITDRRVLGGYIDSYPSLGYASNLTDPQGLLVGLESPDSNILYIFANGDRMLYCRTYITRREVNLRVSSTNVVLSILPNSVGFAWDDVTKITRPIFTITGVIKNSAEVPISNAKVTWVNNSGVHINTVTANASGVYTMKFIDDSPKTLLAVDPVSNEVQVHSGVLPQ